MDDLANLIIYKTLEYDIGLNNVGHKDKAPIRVCTRRLMALRGLFYDNNNKKK